MMKNYIDKKFIIKHIICQSLLFAFAIFLSVSVLLKANYILSVDNFIFNLASVIRCKFINNLFLFITFLGETETIIFILIILLFLPCRKKLIPLYYLTGISVCLNYIIKNLVCRARPSFQFVNNLIINYPFPSSFSFPSGHSQNSLVVYFISAYLLLNAYYKGNHKKLILSLITIIPILIMISRIILGVHFFSDILMGALIAVIIITNYIFLEKLTYSKNKNQANR